MVAMLCVILITLFGSVMSNNLNFTSIDNIYLARFDNCTQDEYNLMKCINGVCLARSDLLERQPFCLCLTGYDGIRCETTIVPYIPLSMTCEKYTYAPIGVLICCIITCLFLVIYTCYKYKTVPRRGSLPI
jgi:hypothetical protein